MKALLVIGTGILLGLLFSVEDARNNEYYMPVHTRGPEMWICVNHITGNQRPTYAPTCPGGHLIPWY